MAKKKYIEDYYDIDTLTKKYRKNNKKNNRIEFGINKKVISGAFLAFVILSGVIYSVNDNNMIVSVSSDDIIKEDVSASELDSSGIKESTNEIEDISSDNTDFINSQIQIYDNSDIVMYLYLLDENGVVEYGLPIVQSVNNTYYLDHDLYNQRTKDGTIFLDYNVNVQELPKNVAIYGSNLYETSSLFNIEKYNDKSFFDKNKMIKIDTNEKTYYYEIFAFCENDYTFTPEPTEFLTEEGFNNYLEQIERTSIYFDYGVGVYDEIMTLSTTTNKFGDKSRYELFAKRVQ